MPLPTPLPPHRQRVGRARSAVLAGMMLMLTLTARAGPPSSWPAAETGAERSLNLAISSRAQVFYEPRPWRPAPPSPLDAGLPPARAALGIDFQTSGGTAKEVRSLLQLKLSGGSVLNVRPRGGGLSVAYRTQF